MEYYTKVRNIREDRDIKQYEFAKLIEIKPKTYNLYESGSREIPVLVMEKIVNILGCSLDSILGLKVRYYPSKFEKIDLETYAKNIRKFRKDSGKTQAELAKTIGCRQQTLSEYEKGKIVMPLSTLKIFCRALDVSADVVTGRVNI